MKLFTNFCGFFALFASSALALGFFILSIVRLNDYFNCSVDSLKDIYLNAFGSYLSYCIIALIIGFALSAIIYLLRNIAYKDEK